ncbi:uncharacterized protein si:ch211-13c6.2 isoform X2 [Polypterus senegalus]|uniref:uncharacterized protein si:ch211-13c6.2 isoform X2 n=1 Tax=Polypterus senegalus TaxID=55291 RepID=UPI00196565E8|nr:uncharacterized protein si:ch211-13c6.2 isoform X2 [Polypterus senegalus]
MSCSKPQTSQSDSELIECKICDVKLHRETNYKIHLTTSQHLKKEDVLVACGKLRRDYSLPKWENMNDYFDYLQLDEPLIGLQNVAEVDVKPGEVPKYLCRLCFFEAEMADVALHIVGKKHRKKYLETHRPDLVTWRTDVITAQLGKTIRAQAELLEQQEGRGEVEQSKKNASSIQEQKPKAGYLKSLLGKMRKTTWNSSDEPLSIGKVLDQLTAFAGNRSSSRSSVGLARGERRTSYDIERDKCYWDRDLERRPLDEFSRQYPERDFSRNYYEDKRQRYPDGGRNRRYIDESLDERYHDNIYERYPEKDDHRWNADEDRRYFEEKCRSRYPEKRRDSVYNYEEGFERRSLNDNWSERRFSPERKRFEGGPDKYMIENGAGRRLLERGPREEHEGWPEPLNERPLEMHGPVEEPAGQGMREGLLGRYPSDTQAGRRYINMTSNAQYNQDPPNALYPDDASDKGYVLNKPRDILTAGRYPEEQPYEEFCTDTSSRRYPGKRGPESYSEAMPNQRIDFQRNESFGSSYSNKRPRLDPVSSREKDIEINNVEEASFLKEKLVHLLKDFQSKQRQYLDMNINVQQPAISKDYNHQGVGATFEEEQHNTGSRSRSPNRRFYPPNSQLGNEPQMRSRQWSPDRGQDAPYYEAQQYNEMKADYSRLAQPSSYNPPMSDRGERWRGEPMQSLNWMATEQRGAAGSADMTASSSYSYFSRGMK